jgi:2-polyprenyl-3-methyl-5-hydroxy-6-metoxy-1,4-benzoquinol methylase
MDAANQTGTDRRQHGLRRWASTATTRERTYSIRSCISVSPGEAFTSALDVGCGEGRFCRMIREQGISTVGIDPTRALLERGPSSRFKRRLPLRTR